MSEHNLSKTPSTRPRRTFDPVYYEAYAAGSDAKQREKQIKHRAKAYGQLKRRIANSIKEV